MPDSASGGFPSRRTALRAGLAAALAGAVLPAAACGPNPPGGTMTVAGGEPGGFYLEFATLLAGSLRRHGVAADASALETGGSLDNMDRLARGEATLAIALADAAVQRGGGMAALGKVYENYVHCVVRTDSGIAAVADLAGHAVAVGDPRSGTSLTAHRLLDAAGITVRAMPLGLNQGLAALRSGSVEALFWSGGVPTAAIAAATKEVSLRLLDLSPLIPAIRAAYGGFYDRVLVQEDSYQGIPAAWTVGVANLLLCREDLGADVVRATVDLLLQHANELVPASSLGVQFLSPETLINTSGIPLHPAAEEAYRAFHG
ncbi:TAXI family TRAP transporter solute-binding subunit [Sinomonas flava]|uniref:TAXI family TRAP transporter solute-binding subunit n=1 Tax=Sinomonas flava TaxID=496857 RepID=UPI0039A48DE8